jgi:hypothetical protein
MLKRGYCLLLLLMLWYPGFSKFRKVPVGVVDLDPSGIKKSEAVTLTNKLRTELFRTGIFEILERKEMHDILTEQGFQQSGCVSTECIVEMGQLIGVKQIVAGNIGRLGEKYILDVRMVDVGTGRMLATGSEECTCPLEDLTYIIEKVALKLSGVERRERVTIKYTKSRKLKEKGNFYIKSIPSGASVYLNDELMNEPTPLVIEDIPVGKYLIRLESGDYAGNTQVVLNNNDFNTIDLKLTKKRGRLKVITRILQTDVYIDDKYRGKTPIVFDSLAVGDYNIKIKRQGYLELSRNVIIEQGKETVMDFEMEKPGPLKILSVPLEAEIIIDGELRGQTPTVITGLSPGAHSIEIRKEGFSPYVNEIQMVSSSEIKIEPSLISLYRKNNNTAPVVKEDDKGSERADRIVKWIIIGSGVAFLATGVVVIAQ